MIKCTCTDCGGELLMDTEDYATGKPLLHKVCAMLYSKHSGTGTTARTAANRAAPAFRLPEGPLYLRDLW